MRTRLPIIVAVLIAAGFLMFAFTRTIHFTEAAVVSTWGRADESSVVVDPGLIFRWPAPIQSVTVYDTRARILATRSETQQTADNRQIVVSAFLTWRVDDPLRFFQRFSGEGSEERRHFSAAERTLQSQLRSAMSEVSRYRLDELFSPTPGASKLAELEDRIFARLIAASNDGVRVADWGIEPVLVGIERIVLPEDTTRDVFERMKATRQRMASEAESRGEAEGATIRASADSAARRILSFADNRAAQIRNRGDEEAARYMEALNTAPALAIFLEQIEFLRAMYGKRATLVLPTEMPGLGIFHPHLLSRLNSGGLPDFVQGASEIVESHRRDNPESVEPAVTPLSAEKADHQTEDDAEDEPADPAQRRADAADGDSIR